LVQADDFGTAALKGSTYSGTRPAIGSKALEGSVWMIGATGAAKASGFACQLALAWFLTKEDYGVYAIAISLSVFLSVLRDGGLPQVLEQKGTKFDLYVGPIFWMMLVMNCATALLVALIAAPAAKYYGIPALSGVMTLFAISIPLSVLPSILTARLIVNLRFRELGLVQVASALTRNGLLLLFAWAGFGPRSFLLPILITSTTDSLLLWLIARCSPWAMAPRFRLWPELFSGGRWVMLGTFSIALGNNGSYFVLGKLLPSELVGTYFFAYQLVIQLGVLLSDNVYQILVGSFALMRDEWLRIRAAVPRALSIIVLIGAAASLLIAAIFEPLERALWHGKWAGAAYAIQILAVTWPATAGVSVLRALQMATGHFRQWGVVTLVSALACVAGAALGASRYGSAAATAMGFGVGAVLGAALNAAVALPHIGVSVIGVVRSVFRPWLIIAAAAACSHYVGSFFLHAWMDVAVVAASFCTLSLIGLKIFARDSLALVAQSLQRIAGGIARAPPLER
jgi:O-antigen/teichoic acid export membrane protein